MTALPAPLIAVHLIAAAAALPLGLWVAFGFTFLPGRLLHRWLFG